MEFTKTALDRAAPERWVGEMARTLVQEITEVMAGIRFRPAVPPRPRQAPRLEAITGHVEGDYHMELRFLAEPGMLRRLAENMMAAPADEETVREYAMEFFNVLCGRFISELYKATGTSARFFPTRYELSPDLAALEDPVSMRTLYFISDQEELAAFSWTAAPINELLRRKVYA